MLVYKYINYPPKIFINNGMNTFEGRITSVAILTPKLVPITTRRILNMLLFHRSRKLSILLKFLMSLCLTFLNLASVNPENHPAASNGWMIVKGATNPPTIADINFEPDNIDPIKPIIMLITMNSYMFQVMFIPLK